MRSDARRQLPPRQRPPSIPGAFGLILILGDSVSLPRPTDGIEYEHTWPKILADSLDEPVLNVSKAAITSAELLSLARDYFHYYRPRLALFQFGVVDASPRVFGQYELRLLKLIPRVRTIVHDVANKHHARLTAARNITYTSERQFAANIQGMLSAVPTNCKICFLEILPPGRAMMAKSPLANEKFNRYNAIFTRFADNDRVFTLSVPDAAMLPDGHHLCVGGHAVVASALERFLMEAHLLRIPESSRQQHS